MAELGDSLFGAAREYVAGRGEFDALYLTALRLLPPLVEECPEDATTELAKLIVHSDARRSAGELTDRELLKTLATFLGKSPSIRASSA